MGATPIEQFCTLRTAVDELLSSLERQDEAVTKEWSRNIAGLLDEIIAEYGDEGKATLKSLRKSVTEIKWREEFMDGSRAN